MSGCPASARRKDLRGRRRDARADPGIADRALQHGRRADQFAWRGRHDAGRQSGSGRPRIDGHRRGRLRVGSRRQPARAPTRCSISSCSGGPRRRRVVETLRPHEGHADVPKGSTERAIARFDRIRWSKGKTGAGAIRLAMQRTMQRHCAVFRDGPLLAEGLGKLDGVIETMRADLGVADRSMMFNTDLTRRSNSTTCSPRRASACIRRSDERKAAAHMRGRTFRSGTMKTGSSTAIAGSTTAARCGSTTGRCTCKRFRTTYRRSSEGACVLIGYLAVRAPPTGRIP